MHLAFLFLRLLSPDGGVGGSQVVDMYGEDGDDNPLGHDAPALDPAAPAATLPPAPAPLAPAPSTPGTPGNDPAGLGVGPALGANALKDNLTIAQITGQPEPAADPATPAAAAATPGAAPAAALNYAGFQSPNDFAERVLGQPGGLIQFEGDPAPTPFADLTPQEQQQVITDWSAAQPTNEERSLLQQVRSSGGIDGYVARQLAQLTNSPASLADDEVAREFIKRDDPQADDAAVQAALDYEKQNPNYAKRMASWRNQLTQEQKVHQQRLQDAENNMYAQTAHQTKAINGVLVDDPQRNQLLNDVLEPDPTDATQTKFVKLFENPSEVLEMAWLRRYGKPLLEQAIRGGFLSRPAGSPTPAAPQAPPAPPKSRVNDMYAE